MLEFAEMMVELILNDCLHHFFRWHLGRIGPHPPTVAPLDIFGVLDGQQLQQAGRYYGEIDKGLDRVHGIGEQALGCFRHILQLLKAERLTLWDLPCFCPEVVAEPADDVLDHFESDLNLEPLGIEADNLRGCHGEIRTDQNERPFAVLDEHETQSIPKGLPQEIQTGHRKRLRFVIDVYRHVHKVICPDGSVLPLAPGLPPVLTIMALARRPARRLV